MTNSVRAIFIENVSEFQQCLANGLESFVVKFRMISQFLADYGQIGGKLIAA